MKRTGLLILASVIVMSMATVTSLAHADTSINVSNNGTDVESDISVKTTNGKSTVCINGECTTHEGNVDIKAENGKTTIKVNNAIGKDATSSSKVKEQSKKEAKNEVIKKLQEERFEIMKFFQNEINSLKKLFSQSFF
jgi:hypothetical protein